MACALDNLKAGVLGQFGKFTLECCQQFTTNWLLADCQYSQRQIAERRGGIQLLATYRP
jgi:hypothetical protein